MHGFARIDVIEADLVSFVVSLIRRQKGSRIDSARGNLTVENHFRPEISHPVHRNSGCTALIRNLEQRLLNW